MNPDKTYDKASEIDAHEGRVAVSGPDGVSVMMTPEAAEETSHRLLEGALEARGQNVRREKRAGG